MRVNLPSSDTGHRMPPAPRVIRFLTVVGLAAALTITGCNTPFPAAPDRLPDCSFQPAIERCTSVKDSVYKHIRYNRSSAGAPTVYGR